MNLQVKGKLQQLLKAESGVSRAGNEWKKQEFILETNEQFPKKICFTLFNDKLSLLNNVEPGDEVEVSFSIESREYNGKWFHNINAWKIEKTAEANSLQNGSPEYRVEDIPPEPEGNGYDNLPF